MPNCAARMLVLMALCGCVDAAPCVTCPDLEGSYAVSFIAARGNEGCATARARPATLTLSQVGAVLRSTLDDVPLAGTVYDTYDFTLTGIGARAQVRVRGRAVVDTGGEAPDGGLEVAATRLTGTVTIAPADGGCEARDEFTADRVSR